MSAENNFNQIDAGAGTSCEIPGPAREGPSLLRSSSCEILVKQKDREPPGQKK